MNKDQESGLGRRQFLASAATAGAASVVAATTGSAAVAAGPEPVKAAAAEGDPAEAPRLGGIPGSDFMIDVIKSLDIKYAPSNCASSFRGLHESMIDYGRNVMPEYLNCMHEESAVGMAHGYFKIAGKPLMSMVHGTVGLQHASMAIYNAWCDRVPVIIVAGNDLDAAYRPPWVPTLHSAQDVNGIVRDYTKWDDTPVSLQHFAQSFVRAYKIAMTPPYAPVSISLDAGLQQEPMNDHRGKITIPRYVPTSPPAGDSGAIKEAARLLAEARNPVILVDRVARTQEGIPLLIQLAELLQAKVVDYGSRMNFPSMHYLRAGPGAVADADVIVGMELTDFWGAVNSFTDNGEHGGVGVQSSRIKPGTKLISISSVELLTKSNYQDFQRFQPVDIQMAADAQATLLPLIEAVKSALTASSKTTIEARGRAARPANEQYLARLKQMAALGWDASPISTARLAMETYAAVKDLDWSCVSAESPFFQWPETLWPMEKHYQWIGRSGGFGIGYGIAASVGAALANKEHGRFSVSFQADGDLMYAPGVLWTAAHHKIPLLSVMHNNRGYHQELMHVQRIAAFRNRKVNNGPDMGPVGTSIMNPDIEYHKLAESMGWWAKGPIKNPAQLAPALKEAVAVVRSGQPALLNVWTQPR